MISTDEDVLKSIGLFISACNISDMILVSQNYHALFIYLFHFFPYLYVYICLPLTLLSNRPVGALVGIARPVVNSVGLSFKMAPEGVLEFTCLEKVSIYCNILFLKRGPVLLLLSE